ncbi:DNA polymerase III subunit delta [Alkaliphilus sp. B6464]|uniref:DNA polymerase III subunit delta n=1 Tax=Alkaliphilus sp. B6464 TaxID=2731219 RepID=UPI001BADD231|nr:DNA polymerase III subunit delta [Alkaliphilus sp. B6464]QUH21932.1 DNA polymerase III subunit delta [Alkaliphilus sp. B6464]
MEFNKVIYINSEEVFLLHEKLKEIKMSFINQHLDFNYREFPNEINAAILRNEIETYPLMAEKKMIVLKEIKEDDEMVKLFQDIPDFCSIIIVATLDKRKKLFKSIKKIGEVIELKPYNESQMVNWIVKKAEESGIKISKKCASKIISLCGLDDMYNIYTEIIKLSNMNQEITEELIEKVVTKSIEYDSFQIVNAISNKDKANAYQLIHNFCQRNEYFPLIVSLINRNFAILKMMKTMKDNEIKDAAGIHPYSLKVLKPYVKQFNEENLDFYINVCSEIDFDMKNGIDHRIALEKLIGVIE